MPDGVSMGIIRGGQAEGQALGMKLNSEGEQLFVGNGRPQEQSKSGGQLMSSQALHSGTLRFGFHDKQKMWRDENSLEWLRDGRQKIGRH